VALSSPARPKSSVHDRLYAQRHRPQRRARPRCPDDWEPIHNRRTRDQGARSIRLEGLGFVLMLGLLPRNVLLTCAHSAKAKRFFRKRIFAIAALGRVLIRQQSRPLERPRSRLAGAGPFLHLRRQSPKAIRIRPWGLVQYSRWWATSDTCDWAGTFLPAVH
jgi:hypothetical protein